MAAHESSVYSRQDVLEAWAKTLREQQPPSEFRHLRHIEFDHPARPNALGACSVCGDLCVRVNAPPSPRVCRICGHALSEGPSNGDAHEVCLRGEDTYLDPQGTPF
jgi:hypothetical protein